MATFNPTADIDVLAARQALANSRVDWGHYGADVEGLTSSAEVMEKSGLDFEVTELPLFAKSGDKTIDVTSKKLLVRADIGLELGVVGKDYQVVQNSELFDFLDTAVGVGELKYVKAGMLREGDRVWVQAELPGTMRVGGTDDEIKKYILCHTSHDGSSAVRVMVTPIRLWCQNQLLNAIRNAESSFSIRHTRTAQERLNDTFRAITMANQTFSNLQKSYDRMLDHKMTEREAMNFFETLVPDNPEATHTTRTENVRNQIMLLYHAGAGSEVTHGTMWGAYNAVIEYVDHFRTVRGNNMDSRFEGSTFGSGSLLKKAAFEIANQFMN